MGNDSPKEKDKPSMNESSKNPNPNVRLPHDPNRALEPGRPFLADDSLLGEIASHIYDAEQKGEAFLAAEFRKCEVMAGEFVQYLKSLEHPLYSKILKFFL